MTSQPPPEVRAIVAQVVRDVVADTERRAALRRGPTPDPIPAPQPSGPLNAGRRSRVETVRITGSRDLHAFVQRLLDLFENPKTREDLRTGRLRFELAGGVAAPAAPGVVERIEQGAVTERMVAAAAATGARLVLGRRAVLTPLASEKARTLGVPVEKERS
jgi:hypothetical protein